MLAEIDVMNIDRSSNTLCLSEYTGKVRRGTVKSPGLEVVGTSTLQPLTYTLVLAPRDNISLRCGIVGTQSCE